MNNIRFINNIGALAVSQPKKKDQIRSEIDQGVAQLVRKLFDLYQTSRIVSLS